MFKEYITESQEINELFGFGGNKGAKLVTKHYKKLFREIKKGSITDKQEIIDRVTDMMKDVKKLGLGYKDKKIAVQGALSGPNEKAFQGIISTFDIKKVIEQIWDKDFVRELI